MAAKTHPHTIIVGGGFGGLHAAKVLGVAGARVTLLDRRNFHLFQPLLYQVATGGLSPGDISSPIRAVMRPHRNALVLQDEVNDIDPEKRAVKASRGSFHYDRLIVATGVTHHYFGHDSWAASAPGLKTVEDALDMRRRILHAFEAAEKTEDLSRRLRLLTFVVVGGGPTGVELAGSIAELARATLRREFRRFDPAEARIFLLEGTDRVLPGYPPDLSRRARRSLERLGVTVSVGTMVTSVERESVTAQRGERSTTLEASTILWAAGVRASRMGRILHERCGARLDDAGRVFVEPDLSIAGHPEVMVIGDLAHFRTPDGGMLPGVAQVAMQQGRYAARVILGRVDRTQPFHYHDRGNLAVIGRNRAVAHIGRLKFGGFPAWVIWAFVHITNLIEFDNRMLVFVQWAMNYFTRKRGARLITNERAIGEGVDDAAN